ncbi:TonB-linked outer membrane protein, SusC/RagA family [Polaribacter sp. KT25b]|uniref:SusC/RagA family TonB-linked outer membrane protein n=1 Tax=Polaribacter sp. KT25b TaxID=1855336 RepID=UPI00087CCE51|nr:TonB-dependent receptor [Polaribacter sp. KT25b]SDS57675.1 TonB-linked outer membrane protein, SusC/RagA family [Polaribacter sp. KT25b]
MSKNNLIKKISTCLFLLASLFAYSQQKVTGKVTDDTSGGVLPGVSVQVKGTTTGTSTDFDGLFSLKVPNNEAILVFSYIGYAKQEIKVDGKSTINVILKEDASTLDEIIIVGYGTSKKSHLTGSVSKIGGDDVAAVQATRVDEALAGKLSGVLIQNASGGPGADPKIQIRAASSISSDSNPLIVVDGFPISGSLATVNPSDIESMEVLKDAASAAIYGSRGANGVILVTTKTGKSGKTTFNYNTYLSVSNKYRDNILKTGSEWAAFSRKEIAAGNWDLSQIDPAFIEYRLSAYENSPGEVSVEDWLYQSGTSVNHDFSMSGGTDTSNYFASVGYQDTEGIVRTQGYERFNARLNVNTQFGEKFKTGLSFNGFMSKRDIVAHDIRDLARSYSFHPIYHTEESIAFVQDLDRQAQALGLNGFDSGRNSKTDGVTGYVQSIQDLVPGDFVNDWHYGRANNGIGGSGDQGPAAKLDNATNWEKTYFFNVSSYLEYNIMEGLNLKTVLGADLRDTQLYYYQGILADNQARWENTDLDQTDTKRSSVLSTTTLSYAKEIGKHDISAVAGIEFQNNYTKATQLLGSYVPFGEVINYGLLEPENITVSERNETSTRRSVFGRVSYAYDDKYLASVSLRRDGDSRFGANNRYEVFPAVSLGWNLHKEDFLADNEKLSKLKLRFSTGSLGTASFLGAYSSLSLLESGTTVYGNGYLIPTDVANPDLTWQTNTETNFGVDFGFVNNRYTLGVDYYTSDIENILLEQSVSEVLGTNQIKLNSGDVKSTGLEFELGADLIRKEDLSWNLSANLSTVKTEITDLGERDELPRLPSGQSGRDIVFRNYVGGQIGEMWGIETAGQVEMKYLEDPTRSPNNTSGEYYVVDQQGDGIIDITKTVEEGGDLIKVGNNTPDFYWGLNSSINYKAFDISMQFQGAQGGEVFNVDPYYYGSQWGGRLVDNFKDADGRAVHNGMFVKDAKSNLDANVQDASYLALRNLTIGYTVEDNIVEKMGLSSIRIYGAATNLLYIFGDDYTSYNPEGIETTGDYQGPVNSGFQIGASPVVRSFTVGLNVKF